MISRALINFFETEGYLVVENLISKAEVAYYEYIFDSFLNNTIDASRYRSDLSGDDKSELERITQIMVPSKVHPELLTKPIHQRTLQIARTLLGGDMELDFDMLINKAPHSNTITPWHQDTAYWIDMPDKRALSCWIAIDRPQKKTVVCGTRQNRIWNLHVLMSKPEIKARLGVVEMKQSRFMWS